MQNDSIKTEGDPVKGVRWSIKINGKWTSPSPWRKDIDMPQAHEIAKESLRQLTLKK